MMDSINAVLHVWYAIGLIFICVLLWQIRQRQR
jgi:hypothetical protein